MSDVKLLSTAELPVQFEYPREFLRIIRLGIVDLEPWYMLDGDHLRKKLAGMSKRYPAKSLVPFAVRKNNDYTACWDGQPGKVYIVHDFASPGYENRMEFENFYSWLRAAIDDCIEFDT